MDIEHESLLNKANYANLKTLKQLYKSYDNLYKLSLMGNRAAIAIFIDLCCALTHVTPYQRSCIIRHLIDGYTLSDVADADLCTLENIYLTINGGLRKVRKILLSGEVYCDDYRRSIRILEDARCKLPQEKPSRYNAISLPDK